MSHKQVHSDPQLDDSGINVIVSYYVLIFVSHTAIACYDSESAAFGGQIFKAESNHSYPGCSSCVIQWFKNIKEHK